MTNAQSDISNPTNLSDYDWLEFVALVWKVRNEGSYGYAVENWPPAFESSDMQAIAASQARMLAYYQLNRGKVDAWWDVVGGDRAVELHNAHIRESQQREQDACLWGIRCTDGHVITCETQERRDHWAAELRDDHREGRRMPEALLSRTVPGGEWTEDSRF
ncbi:hypothetical protein ACH4GZ_38715 [Streptomyces hygroscopicus]|uniref:hypothetical protein n=1 Tax=Streptomyces hygroscopicus TaxID=1912 RepID=UPI0037A280F8